MDQFVSYNHGVFQKKKKKGKKSSLVISPGFYTFHSKIEVFLKKKGFH